MKKEHTPSSGYKQHPPLHAHTAEIERRDFLKIPLVIAAAGKLSEIEIPLHYEQDPLPPPPKISSETPFIQLAEAVPPREVLVTEDDVRKAYTNLKTFRTDLVTLQKEVFHLFSRTEKRLDLGSAWDNQHPASAISTYRKIKGALPEGMPEPTDIIKTFWTDRQPPCYTTSPKGYTGEAYTDDGAWFANIEADQYEILQKKGDEQRKKFVLARTSMMFRTGIRNKEYDDGIYWTIQPDKNKYKAAVANGPIALLGVKLAKIDSEYKDHYVEETKLIYKWMKHTLLDPKTHLYADGIETKQDRKEIVTNFPTYAQAHMIEAGLGLAELTGEKKYKDDAEKTAYTVLTTGDMYTDPTVYFDAILIKSLYNMYLKTDNTTMKDLIKDRIVLYGNNLVRNKKLWNREDGKYKKRNPKVFETDVQCQAAAAEILLIANSFKTPEITTA